MGRRRRHSTGGLPRAEPASPLFALRGILAHIAELESKTDWAITVVDVFRDDLDEAVLAEMARLIEAAPLASQAAYERTLQRAEQSGSEHATRLLRELAK